MEFVSRDVIVPKLIQWFNNQTDDADRTIGSSEIAIFKVKIMRDGGELAFIVNPDPTVAYQGTYVGEVVYMWAGARGEVAVADDNSFVQLSMYAAPKPITFVTPGV